MKTQKLRSLQLVKSSIATLNEKNQQAIVGGMGGSNNDPMSNSRCITSCRTR